MTKFDGYISRLLAERANLEVRLKELELKIKVAREIQAEVDPAVANGVLKLDEESTSKPLVGLGTTKAIALYIDLHPEVQEIQPYTLFRKLEAQGFRNESKNVRQIVARTFINWAEPRGWYSYDKGVWRKNPSLMAEK